MPDPSGTFASLLPWIEALTRLIAGFAFVPHGLRATFGWFAGDGPRFGFASSVGMLEARGFRPGRVWIWGLVVTQLVAAPLLALGLFTRPAALVCFVFLVVVAVDRLRGEGWFWNRMGAEYPVVWAALVLPFVLRGGGPVSLDALLGIAL